MLQRACNTRRNREGSHERCRTSDGSRFANCDYLGDEGSRRVSAIVPRVIRCGEAPNGCGLTDINCLPYRYETPALPHPSTFIRPSTGLTARSRRQSDVACCSPTIIGVINADRENPMCARGKRVTRLQKRSRGLGRGTRGVNRMRRVGTRVISRGRRSISIILRPATKSSAPGTSGRRDLRRALFADVYLIP